MNAATKTGLDALETTSKNISHQAGEAKGEYIVNKFTKIVKPKPVPDVNLRNNYSNRKTRWNTEWIKTCIIKIEH